jgi:uncharacterized integral membrane protein
MWLKIKVWTKILIGSALALYTLLFVYNNTGQKIEFWWWFQRSQPASVFTLAMGAFILGVIVTVMAMTTFRTLRQVRELRERSRSQRIERELSDMKSKAAMLQTRPATMPATAPPPQELPE